MVYTTLKQLPIRLGVSVIMVGTLVACGCGSSTPEVTPPVVVVPVVKLSASQAAFEAAALGKPLYALSWNSPANNVVPTVATNFFYANGNVLATTPTLGSQTLAHTTVNLAVIALPNLAQRNVVRNVVGGKIYARSLLDKTNISYAGDNVVSNLLASDGVTVMYSIVLSDFTAVAMTGNVIDSPLDVRAEGFIPFATGNSNYDLVKPWLAGATYYKRTTKSIGETLGVLDCSGITYDANVNACSTTATTVDNAFFPRTITGTTTQLQLTDGTIKTIAGVRTWVANTANPTTTSYAPTTYRTYFELNGKIYYGAYSADGSLYQANSRLDATQVIAYSLRYNEAAINSVKTTLKF